ncbi:MAG TPA: MFS transporter, partial [Bacteroidetes bacterium]|nr:MFS transporter [Bacteroidota bacterium]
GPLFGKIGDKKHAKDKRGWMQVVLFCLLSGAICYIIAFSLGLISHDMIIVIIFLIFTVLGAFLFGGIDPLTQATLGEINPPQIRSTIYSINYLTYTLGRSISLLLLGEMFISFGSFYSPGYLILSIMALGCSLVLIPILKILPKDIEKIKSRKIKET